MVEETVTSEGKKLEDRRDNKLTFKCRFCQQSRPVEDMVLITRFFPPMVACRECEKALR